MSSISGRRPYQGVMQILQFNWPYYSVAGIAAGMGMLALPFLHAPWNLALLIAIVPAIFWLASSLIVSHYVYDRFPLYDLKWIACALERTPEKWINIHCGFDETSDLLASTFPHADRCVVDIYDPQVMTEGSIGMAQGRGNAQGPFMREHYDSLSFRDGSFDAAFLIFAAHELRQHDQRVKLFREVARVLAPGRDLIVMEHSRDIWNFIAFGPGALHFFSQSAWRKAASEARFTLKTEWSMTRFVHVYHLRKPA